MKKIKRVLVFADYLCNTGFGVVTKNIVGALSERFAGEVQFDVVAINWFGDELKEGQAPPVGTLSVNTVREVNRGVEREVRKVTAKVDMPGVYVFGAQVNDGTGDKFGRNTMLSLLNTNDYDLLFMIQDRSVVVAMMPVIESILSEKRKNNRRMFKMLYYAPVDSMLTEEMGNGLEKIDRIVAYTDFAKQQIKHALGNRYKNSIGVIYHGVDARVFRPLKDREDQSEFRKAFFKDNADKFIVGNINRNQYRKDMPSTILAFARFKYLSPTDRGKFLYLHCDPADPMGWDLRHLLSQVSLKEGEDYMFTPPGMEVDDRMMALIYGSLDMYVTTTTGEGFGLTIVEALAMGLPVVMPYHTSVAEIYDRIGGGDGMTHFCDNLRPYCATQDSRLRMAVDVDAFAGIMTVAESRIEECHSYDVREMMSPGTPRHNFISSISWGKIQGKWIDEVKKMLW